MIRKVYFASMLYFFAGFATAGELYKWVDSNGRVHFSDKKQGSAAETVNIDAQAEFVAAPQSAPIPRQTNQEVLGLWVVNTEFLIADNQEIGTYSFGGDCVSPTAMVWPEAQTHHPDLFRLDSYPGTGILFSINDLGYRARGSSPSTLHDNLRIMKGYALWSKITGIEYSVCAPQPSEEWKYRKNKGLKMGFDPSQLHSSDFSRQRITVTVHWTMKDEASGKTLFESETRGSKDSWSKNASTNKSLQDALANATRNLFAKAEFVDLLNAPPLMVPTAIPQEELHPDPRPEKGFFDGMLENLTMVQAKRQANFAKVITFISPIKVTAQQHYLSEGQWPDNFEVLGFSERKLRAEGYIEKLAMRPGGAIVIYLDKQNFDQNGVIVLTPRQIMDNTSTEWQCSTNLEDEYFKKIMPCTTLR